MIAFSSCNVLNDPAHFRYLNKVEVNSPDSKNAPTIVPCDQPRDISTTVEKANDSFPDSLSKMTDEKINGIELSIEKTITKSHQCTTTGVSEKVGHLLKGRPDYAKKDNRCAANAGNKKNTEGSTLLLIAVIIAGIITAAAMTGGASATILALGIIAAGGIIALIVYSFFNPKKVDSKPATPENDAAFIDEPLETKPTDGVREEMPNKKEKATNTTVWIVAGILTGVLLLTLVFGFAVIILSVILGLFVGFVALIVWLCKMAVSS